MRLCFPLGDAELEPWVRRYPDLSLIKHISVLGFVHDMRAALFTRSVPALAFLSLARSHPSGPYPHVIFSHRTLGTCWLWPAPGLVLNKAPSRVAAQSHRPPFRAWSAPRFLCQSLAGSTSPSSAPGCPFSSFWGAWAHFLRDVSLDRAPHPTPPQSG